MEFNGEIEIEENNLLSSNFFFDLRTLIYEHITPKNSSAAQALIDVTKVLLKSHGMYWIIKDNTSN